MFIFGAFKNCIEIYRFSWNILCVIVLCVWFAESALANLEKRARKLLKQEPHGCLKFTAYDVIVGVYRKLAEKTSDVVHDTSKG